MKLLFVSDVHLMEHQNFEYTEFLKFLKFVLKSHDVNHLFLVGDIFDIWVSNKNIFSNYFSDIVSLLLAIAKQGTNIHYFEGNHDLYLKHFFKEKKNIFTYNSPEYFVFNDLKFKIEHGDLINKKDYWYFKWKALLNSTVFKKFVKVTPGFFIFHLASLLSFCSFFKRRLLCKNSRAMPDLVYKDKIRKMIRYYADTECKEEDVDIFIHGHLHVADLYQYIGSGKNKYSINLGEWRHSPHVLSIDNGEVSFKKLELFLKK